MDKSLMQNCTGGSLRKEVSKSIFYFFPSLRQFPPGCQNNSIVIEVSLQFRRLHSQHVRPAQRAGVADVGKHFSGGRAVHDDHRDARLKAGKRVHVFFGMGGHQLFVGQSVVGGVLPIVTEVVQVIEYGQAGVPQHFANGQRLFMRHSHSLQLLENHRIVPAGEHDGDSMSYSELKVTLQVFRRAEGRPHVRVEVRRFEAHPSGTGQLAFELPLHVVRGSVLHQRFHAMPQAAFLVEQVRRSGAGEWRPAVILPFGSEGQV